MPRHVPIRSSARVTLELRRETVSDAHVWWRIADPAWTNPLDPGYARKQGGRWNPPDSFPVLYLNEDMMTAQLNLRGFIAKWPYEPEDLRDDTGPILLGCVLPRRQVVCDAHSKAGVRALGLPDTYPLEADGTLVPHARCQPIGVRVKAARLRGVHARSAQSRHPSDRELAWFPASVRSVARRVRTLAFAAWYWGSPRQSGSVQSARQSDK